MNPITPEELDSIRDVWRRRTHRAQQEAIQAKIDLAVMIAYARALEDEIDTTDGIALGADELAQRRQRMRNSCGAAAILGREGSDVMADERPLTFDERVEMARGQLRAIADRQRDPDSDKEDDHMEADAILLDCIADDAVRELFDRLTLWYA